MNLVSSKRFLPIYSGVLTIVLAVSMLCGFASKKKTSFDEIDVHRINVVEPDGTIRLVLSNKAQFPGVIMKGKEYPHPNRKFAGMLFFNDEGTEMGGLGFSGMIDKNGKVSSTGTLSFDQYMQDEVFTIDAYEEDGKRYSGIKVMDRPDYSVEEEFALMQRVAKLPPPEQKVEMDKFYAQRERAHPRLKLGREGDSSVGLRLRDTQGRDRIIIMVKPDGTPTLQFLDQTGKVISQLPAEAKK